MRLLGRAKAPQRLPIHITGWVHDYWLASAAQMADLVRIDPLVQDSPPRHDDRHTIRWLLIADLAVDILLEARRRAGPDVSLPVEGFNHGLEFEYRPPVALTIVEQFTVVSCFATPAVSDIGNGEVTNGRHRIYASGLYGATRLPLQSSILSGWTWEHFGDPRIFMGQLKHKAGLPPDFWDSAVRLSHYTVTKWREGATG